MSIVLAPPTFGSNEAKFDGASCCWWRYHTGPVLTICDLHGNKATLTTTQVRALLNYLAERSPEVLQLEDDHAQALDNLRAELEENDE